VLIIDEAHNTFDAVSEMYTKYIYKCVENYGDVETLGDAIVYLEKKCVVLKTELADIIGDPDHRDRIVEIKKEVEHNYRMISGVQESPKDFFFERVETTYRGKKTEALRLQPLTLNSVGKFLFGNSSKIILMSGTINGIDIKKLGLHKRKVLEVHGQSPIPSERCPVIYEPTANMAFANQHVAIPKLAERILQLAESNQGKGLLHTTYAIAEKLKPYLSSDDRFLFHSKETKDAVYTKFRSSDKSYILVASGMAEGIDLPYEAGRWQIITKIQYPSLADNLMMYIKNNEKDLYAWMTVRTLVQQCGRICRTPEDYGVTYILDTCFENLYKFNKKLFPQYFKERVKFKLNPPKGS
jgi:Rad3-related DNA helicase